MGVKPEEKKEDFPLLAVDKKLAQLIGWTANLVGMVRKFPQGRDRDKAVFVSRKILRSLRSLRGESVAPYVSSKKEKKKPEERKGKREEVKKTDQLKKSKKEAERKPVKKKIVKPQEKTQAQEREKVREEKEKKLQKTEESKGKEEKIIFRKRSPEASFEE